MEQKRQSKWTVEQDSNAMKPTRLAAAGVVWSLAPTQQLYNNNGTGAVLLTHFKVWTG